MGDRRGAGRADAGGPCVSALPVGVPSAAARDGGLGLLWFLPTNGDSRSNVSLGNAVGSEGSRVDDWGDGRPPDFGYLSLIAQTAEHLGFEGALTPTSSWCEDALVIATALSQRTSRFRYLVAFRPGLESPTLAAQAAATFQRVSGGRLLLNVVTGGDDIEQRRFGDGLGKVGAICSGRRISAGVSRVVVGRAGHLPWPSPVRRGRHDHPVTGAAGDLLRRVIDCRDRRRRPVRRRLPDLGRATGCRSPKS